MTWRRGRSKDGLPQLYAHARFNFAKYRYEAYTVERLCRGLWMARWKRLGWDKESITWIPGSFRSCVTACRQHQAKWAMELLE